MKFLKVLLRAAQAAFGVQSLSNMEADFTEHKSPLPFIIAGIVFTILFIITIATLAQLLIQLS